MERTGPVPRPQSGCLERISTANSPSERIALESPGHLLRTSRPGHAPSPTAEMGGVGHGAPAVAPATTVRATGFTIAAYLAYATARTQGQLSMVPGTARTFMVNGEVPPVGRRLVQTEAAESPRLFAQHGSDVLYKGAIGEALVREMEQGGAGVPAADRHHKKGRLVCETEAGATGTAYWSSFSPKTKAIPVLECRDI